MTSENNPILLFIVAFSMGSLISKDMDLIRNLINSFVPIYTVLSALYVLALTLSYAWNTFFSANKEFLPPKKKEKKVEFENKIVPKDESSVALPPPGKKPVEGDGGPSKQIDLTGSYRLAKNDGFKDFLAAQGVNYVLRTAADKAVTCHHVTHNDTTLRIRVSGIITGKFKCKSYCKQ